ncbi:MAG TPA: Asd/ArgC dimerization domain-containing protein [Terriglobus sp.]
MAKTNYRIAVVGAGSLLGKEIGDEIAESPLASAITVLLDNEESSGVLEAMGDEVAFLQAMEPAALENVDVAIFADAKMLREHAGTARAMGAAVVDATGTDAAAPVRLPVIAAAAPLDLETAVVRVAHPVTTMLVLALLQAGRVAPVKAAYATVLQPASENGRAALDELQQQSINLLNFQSAPTEEFDTQVAFNLLPALGEAAKNPLVLTEERVVREWKTLLPGAPLPVLQWLQAPVFHGYSVSLFVEFVESVTLEAVSGAMASEWMDLVGEEGDPPSNLSSAGQGQVLVQVKGDGARYAIWMAADNLKLMARTAVACALELTKMRPLGKVQ